MKAKSRTVRVGPHAVSVGAPTIREGRRGELLRQAGALLKRIAETPKKAIEDPDEQTPARRPRTSSEPKMRIPMRIPLRLPEDDVTDDSDT